MAKTRDTGRRVTGISASALGFGVGVSTTAAATDRDIIPALVTFLEDGRVLFNPENLEVQSEVDHSVVEIRRELTEALQQLDRKSSAVVPLRQSDRLFPAAFASRVDCPDDLFGLDIEDP